MRRILLFLLVSNITNLVSAEPIPDTRRPWSAHDYTILSENIADRTLSMPLGISGEKLALLDRIVSKENLKFVVDIRISPSTRFEMLGEIVQAVEKVLFPDLQAMDQGVKCDVEVAKLSGFMLDWACSAIAVLKELQKPDVPFPKPELTPIRISGIVEMFAGAIDCIKARNLYSHESRLILASKLQVTLPLVWREFASADRAKVLRSLEELAILEENEVTVKIKCLTKILIVNEPNQALEPTSTAVTPPASAGDRASGTRGSP
jgi:hypothetical protein